MAGAALAFPASLALSRHRRSSAALVHWLASKPKQLMNWPASLFIYLAQPLGKGFGIAERRTTASYAKQGEDSRQGMAYAPASHSGLACLAQAKGLLSLPLFRVRSFRLPSGASSALPTISP